MRSAQHVFSPKASGSDVIDINICQLMTAARLAVQNGFVLQIQVIGDCIFEYSFYRPPLKKITTTDSGQYPVGVFFVGEEF